jgi:hypothetical protein
MFRGPSFDEVAKVLQIVRHVGLRRRPQVETRKAGAVPAVSGCDTYLRRFDFTLARRLAATVNSAIAAGPLRCSERVAVDASPSSQLTSSRRPLAPALFLVFLKRF